jgi:hypothetical protein
MKRYAIVHSAQGIYVGNALGFAFFSLTDSAGQHRAAVFENIEQCGQHLLEWDGDTDLAQFRYVEVETEQDMNASCDELEAAGLGDLLGDMRDNERQAELEQMPAMGHC